jgi:hypothetical protein
MYKGLPTACHVDPEGVHLYNSTHSYLTSALDASLWSTPLPGRFVTEEKIVICLQEIWFAPGPMWTDAEDVSRSGFKPRTLYPVARSWCDLRLNLWS